LLFCGQRSEASDTDTSDDTGVDEADDGAGSLEGRGPGGPHRHHHREMGERDADTQRDAHTSAEEATDEDDASGDEAIHGKRRGHRGPHHHHGPMGELSEEDVVARAEARTESPFDHLDANDDGVVDADDRDSTETTDEEASEEEETTDEDA
jgi:hypothetical protein